MHEVLIIFIRSSPGYLPIMRPKNNNQDSLVHYALNLLRPYQSLCIISPARKLILFFWLILRRNFWTGEQMGGIKPQVFFSLLYYKPFICHDVCIYAYAYIYAIYYICNVCVYIYDTYFTHIIMILLYRHHYC